MPQIEKITFLTTVYWIVAFYFFLFFDLNVNYLYSFFVTKKLQIKRLLWIIRRVQVNLFSARMFSSNIGL